MSEPDTTDTKPRLAGYAALIDRYGLDVIPNWHRSLVAVSGTHRVKTADSMVEEVYPSKYWPGESPGDHLEFALKYDGTNLGILASLFSVVDAREIQRYVESKPTGKYARRLWFLYEFLTGKTLPLDDLTKGNYVELLDPKEYYTAATTRHVKRQRINDNLLGGAKFCPTIRRTDTLRRFDAADLPKRCQQVVSSYSPVLLKRALSYLYTKETKSSFEIEHITPSSTRTERFISLLQLAERQDFCERSRLIDLQNRIVDPRFRATDYRSSQNYVGETVAWQNERVHYVCPKPEDTHELMAGLIYAHQRMEKDMDSTVAHAAAVAYGFVFIHPFEDGNGRIHRFLIHNILARRSFTPEGIMFPVSAAMLNNPTAYDASLEAFSRPLMGLVEYTLNDEGRMKVSNDAAVWYRYIDMTAPTEALYRFIERTIDADLVEELTFLANYDVTKRTIQEIVDMPDRQIDLLIRFCLQNRGRLSARKRASHFAFLSDDEVASLEETVQSAYGSNTTGEE
ncbi:MAG: Fic family protein [Planctomycetes bacterium]|nr:Fic family protein [Planctomycetota bacterium]